MKRSKPQMGICRTCRAVRVRYRLASGGAFGPCRDHHDARFFRFFFGLTSSATVGLVSGAVSTAYCAAAADAAKINEWTLMTFLREAGFAEDTRHVVNRRHGMSLVGDNRIRARNGG